MAKIALVGAGDVGIAFAKEFCRSTHHIVVLTGSEKSQLKDINVEVRLTDYSTDSLLRNLQDCDGVISTLSGPSDFYIKAHLNILEACSQSVRCKHMIPSEWNINLEDFPDLPMFSGPTHEVVRSKLRSQQDVKWTMICHGWFMEYLLPQQKNPLREIGIAWAMNHQKKVFDIYGDGSQQVTLTTVGDTARATLALIADSIATRSEMRQATLLAGESITYKDLFEVVKRQDTTWQSRSVTLTEAVDQLLSSSNSNSPDTAMHQLRIQGFTSANHNPKEKVLGWGVGPLTGLHPTSIQEFLDEAGRL
ncbi:uncharacterized protein FTJAE_13948 [Fusarium tjaetaba]|uniref:NmrA-like domain-containing protein n=1 Tax=Fusarium tjaetaba TaxID=1567544 RepID=A0A8H5V7F0_9HYPO|nr:uncharacterized protein FTJAE_13948 [Fusarium tjaetaba]KAF5613321.1 hypothetical protein FTJAE_13948 [Fusarium tjaetaba]